MQQRNRLITRIAGLIPSSTTVDCVLVGVDGIDGAGKTMFADELSSAVDARALPTVRISIDDFHHVRAIRYRRGRSSPDGFWLDSFDYSRLRRFVLEPLGPGGSREYRRSGHDLNSDELLEPDIETAPAGAVVIVDGLFLHRAELVDVWDFSILLEVPFDETVRRMAIRDGTPPDPTDPTMLRYVQGQQIYFQDSDPRQRATVVIENSSITHPVLIARRRGLATG